MDTKHRPNFLVIGVQKAGTTSIYRYLSQHPQVYMSPVKETNFLERDWTGVVTKKPRKIDSLEKYLALFEKVEDEVAVGEASPNYLFHHETSIPVIYNLVPEAKLVVILRNPIERAHSDYLMHIRDAIDGGDCRPLGEQARQRPIKSFQIRKGFYCQSLKAFMDKFGADNLKVCLYDDLVQDPVAMMQDIYSFIGVDDQFVPDTSVRAQKAAVPQNKTVHRVLQTRNPLRSLAGSVLRLVFPEKTRQAIRRYLLSLNYKDKSALPLSLEERRLLRDIYREDILELQELLQRDLSSWLTLPEPATSKVEVS
ncbi:sulfotransferase [Geitlerinema sp. P-1104]|uniref:sulfotransferase family protein n=1 Tax=Geitlerinema sp. P-1104 TaxID=2546230 RepID=UPI0014777995|nr:sulfotransferase [Geitlerinema sp. P-1104]NMG57865.1 sulfotransferase [Geitlerinema sp. P-1104]